MRIDVVWDNETRTIVRYDFQAGWALADFDAALRELRDMLADVPHRVDVIAHFLPGSDPPVGSFSRFRRVQEEWPPQLGVVVITNSGPFVALLLSVFLRVYRQYAARLWLAESLEDARHKIANQPRS